MINVASVAPTAAPRPIPTVSHVTAIRRRPFHGFRLLCQTSEIGNDFVSPQPSESLTFSFAASYEITLHVHGPHHGQFTTTFSPGRNEHGRTWSSVTVYSLPRRNLTRAEFMDAVTTSAT